MRFITLPFRIGQSHNIIFQYYPGKYYNTIICNDLNYTNHLNPRYVNDNVS